MFTFVALVADVLTSVSVLEDDVDVAGNELVDVFSLGGLDRVVLILVVAKVQGEDVGRGYPPAHGGEGPCVKDLLGSLV